MLESSAAEIAEAILGVRDRRNGGLDVSMRGTCRPIPLAGGGKTTSGKALLFASAHSGDRRARDEERAARPSGQAYRPEPGQP